MIDLVKAQIQSAKLIARRATEAVNTSLNSYITSNDSKVQALESYRDAQEAANAPGADSNFAGNVIIAEELTVQGAATVKGEKLATENFVLANAGGAGAGGNVEMTKTYRFAATEGQTEFEFDFVGTSVAVYMSGLKLDTTDYSITAKVEDADGNVTTPSKITLASGVSADTIIHGVAFGGADFYSKTQSDAEFMSRQDILDNYTSKAEEAAANASNKPVLLSSVGDLQGDWVDYDSDGTSGWNAVISKTSDGWVHISGIVTGGSNGTDIIKNLQTKFRPKKNIMSTQKVAKNDGAPGTHRVDVYPNGDILIYASAEGDRPSDSTNWVALNFTYYAGV